MQEILGMIDPYIINSSEKQKSWEDAVTRHLFRIFSVVRSLQKNLRIPSLWVFPASTAPSFSTEDLGPFNQEGHGKWLKHDKNLCSHQKSTDYFRV
jgi:hypothetical protein